MVTTSHPCSEKSSRWEKGTRYYETRLHQDLWGSWVVTRVWGRRGTAWGQVRHLPCGSYAEGLEMLTAIAMRRRQRGYVGVEDAENGGDEAAC